jgi:hypothetical protein
MMAEARDGTKRNSLLRLTKALGRRIIFDKIGTFTGLLRNLSKDRVHRQDFAKHLILREAVNFT